MQESLDVADACSRPSTSPIEGTSCLISTTRWRDTRSPCTTNRTRRRTTAIPVWNLVIDHPEGTIRWDAGSHHDTLDGHWPEPLWHVLSVRRRRTPDRRRPRGSGLRDRRHRLRLPDSPPPRSRRRAGVPRRHRRTRLRPRPGARVRLPQREDRRGEEDVHGLVVTHDIAAIYRDALHDWQEEFVPAVNDDTHVSPPGGVATPREVIISILRRNFYPLTRRRHESTID